MELMKTTKEGLDLIKKFEGCKLFAYRDSVGIPTIGYGHIKNVKMGMAITQQQADAFLKEDVVYVEKFLNRLGVNFKQNQFNALVSWVFNLGVGNFNSSTMKKKILANAQDEDVTDELVRWFNAGGRPLVGLKRRRIAEANMFLGRELYYLDNGNNIKKH